MTSFEYFKQRLQERRFSGFATLFCAGMLSEAVSCLIWLPMDVVKERLQVQQILKIYYYRNSVEACRQIFNSDGILGFYKVARRIK